MKLLLVSCVCLVVGCTRPNPNVCCTSAEDCASIGVDDPERLCAEGLACVENHCEVAACSTQVCGAAAPVCDITLDTCGPCTNNDQCDQFASTSVCNEQSGACVSCIETADCASGVCDGSTNACVECLANSDCPVDKPICNDAHTCGSCALDSDCPSSACDNGKCVPESEVYYVSTSNAIDTNPCSRAAPCATLQHAATRTSAAQENIVVLPGSYSNNRLDLGSSVTNAPRVVIHATGAQFSATGGEFSQFTNNETELVVIGAYVATGNGTAVYCGTGPCTVSHVTIQHQFGVHAGSKTTILDSEIEGEYGGISMGSGTLHLERSVIRGDDPIGAGSGIVEIINTVISGGPTVVDLPTATGTIRFSTIVGGGATGNGPRGVNCHQGLTISDSIVWTPGTAQVPISGGCAVTTSIAGPVPVGGGLNMDPLFVGLADFHLKPTSPAKDMASSGPSTDFEGDPRPSGSGWDIGADEAD